MVAPDAKPPMMGGKKSSFDVLVDVNRTKAAINGNPETSKAC